MTDVEGEVILCFDCGTKNRLKLGWSGTPVCGKCGEVLPVQARPVSNPIVSPRSPASKTSSRVLVIVGIALVAVVGFVVVEANQPSHKATEQNTFAAAPSVQTAAPQPNTELQTGGLTPVDMESAPQQPALPAEDWIDLPSPSLEPAPQQPVLPAVPVNPGIILKNTEAEFIAPFGIKTSPGANYFVKLVDVITSKAIVGIYVVGGSPIEVDVPLGRYEMRYASGQTWYGLEHLFGEGTTTYSKAVEIFEFSIQGNQIAGYTVELIQQLNGNLSTKQIDASQF
jgi:hypothetical protein